MIVTARFLYMAGVGLFGFGTWQEITTRPDDTDEPTTDKQEPDHRYAEAYQQGRIEGYAEGCAAGHAQGLAEGRADNPVREKEGSISFDPWFVLGISPGSTQAAIRKAYREKLTMYHPDKVAHLGKDLQDMADLRAKDINRAYAMLRRR